MGQAFATQYGDLVWMTHGYACIFEDKNNQLVGVSRLEKKGKHYRIGRIVFCLEESWPIGEKRKVGAGLRAMRIRERMHCHQNDWLASVDF